MTRPQLNAPLIVLIGTAGFWTGIGFLIWPLFDWKCSIQLDFSKLTSNGADAVLWSSLIAGQTGLWCVLTAGLSQKLMDYREPLKKRWQGLTWIILCILITVTLYSNINVIQDKDEGGKHTCSFRSKNAFCYVVSNEAEKVRALDFIGSIPFILALSGIYLTGAAAESVHPKEEDFKLCSAECLRIGEDMQGMLSVAGLIIGATTVSTGVLQETLHSLNPGYPADATYAFLFGGLGTAIIALVYLPAQYCIDAASASLRDAALPFPDDVNKISEWRTKQRELNSLLGLDRTTLERLKSGIAILSPLLAGASSYFVLK